MPRTAAVAKLRCSRSPAPGSGATVATTDRATGSIISVVDVFDTHMLTIAVAVIRPSTSRRGWPPARATIEYAMRWCRRQRSIASASRKPPRIRNRIGLP